MENQTTVIEFILLGVADDDLCVLYHPEPLHLRDWLSTTVIPKALANLSLGKKPISLRGCLTYAFLYFMLGTTEFLLLAVMSFDKHVAICKPLHYVTIMNSQVCSLLFITAWIGGAVLIFSPSVKAFSICASYLTVVPMVYGSCIFMYLTSTQINRLDLSKVVTILNTVVSPLLDPFICSLRSTQFKEALRESIKWNLVISKHPEI
nr:PREDICTED: olfactory receptor 49 {ECO:0000312/EMBL:EDL36361.1}-like [Phalacrocorax carbo]